MAYRHRSQALAVCQQEERYDLSGSDSSSSSSEEEEAVPPPPSSQRRPAAGYAAYFPPAPSSQRLPAARYVSYFPPPPIFQYPPRAAAPVPQRPPHQYQLQPIAFVTQGGAASRGGGGGDGGGGGKYNSVDGSNWSNYIPQNVKHFHELSLESSEVGERAGKKGGKTIPGTNSASGGGGGGGSGRGGGQGYMVGAAAMAVRGQQQAWNSNNYEQPPVKAPLYSNDPSRRKDRLRDLAVLNAAAIAEEYESFGTTPNTWQGEEAYAATAVAYRRRQQMY